MTRCSANSKLHAQTNASLLPSLHPHPPGALPHPRAGAVCGLRAAAEQLLPGAGGLPGPGRRHAGRAHMRVDSLQVMGALPAAVAPPSPLTHGPQPHACFRGLLSSCYLRFAPVVRVLAPSQRVLAPSHRSCWCIRQGARGHPQRRVPRQPLGHRCVHMQGPGAEEPAGGAAGEHQTGHQLRFGAVLFSPV